MPDLAVTFLSSEVEYRPVHSVVVGFVFEDDI